MFSLNYLRDCIPERKMHSYIATTHLKSLVPVDTLYRFHSRRKSVFNKCNTMSG